MLLDGAKGPELRPEAAEGLSVRLAPPPSPQPACLCAFRLKRFHVTAFAKHFLPRFKRVDGRGVRQVASEGWMPLSPGSGGRWALGGMSRALCVPDRPRGGRNICRPHGPRRCKDINTHTHTHVRKGVGSASSEGGQPQGCWIQDLTTLPKTQALGVSTQLITAPPAWLVVLMCTEWLPGARHCMLLHPPSAG